MSYDPAVEAFNIAAFLKADCIASIERDESKEQPAALPSPNITRFVAESECDVSQRTHRVEPPMAIHCKSISMVVTTDNQQSVTHSYDSITEVQKHQHYKSNAEELQKAISTNDQEMSMDET